MRKFCLCLLVAGLVTVALATSGFAWTTPLIISPAGDTTCSVPHICAGASAVTHSVFRSKSGAAWHIVYTKRTGAGYWSPLETVSDTAVWSERPDVVEKSGNPYVFWGATGAGAKVDLIWTYKSGSTWTRAAMTNTSTYNEDYPRAAVDSTGKIHLIYFKGSNSDTGSIIYRTYTTSWSGETTIGSYGTKVYYHRADIAVDSSNNVHVTWCTNGTTLVYRKNTGGSWGSQTTIGTGATYWSYPKIGVASTNNIAVACFDQVNGSTYSIKAVTSTNGGANWSAVSTLNSGHYPGMDGYNGNAYLVYMNKPDSTGTGYKTWNGSSWSGATTITTTGVWEGWADVVCGTDSVVASECDRGGQISYVSSSATDTTGPDVVTGLSGLPTGGQIALSWTNPSNADFQGTMIRYKTGSYPTGPTDGTLACNRATAPGAADAYAVTGLTNGTTYYFCAYGHDYTPNYAAAAQTTGTPQAAPKPNLLSNGSITGFTGGVATGWTSYKVNDSNNAITFASDTSNYVNSPSQGFNGIDGATLPASGLTAAGIYQVVSGLTVGKVYQLTGDQDICNTSFSAAGHRYLHNFGINTSGGTTPGTPDTSGNIGGCKWMTSSQGLWNNTGGSSVLFSGFHRATSSFAATATSISIWTGLTLDNAAAKDAAATKFNTDDLFLFEWDFPANAGLQNGNFEGTITDLQDGGDTMPASWVPSGGGIGQDGYTYYQTAATAMRSGSYGFRMANRRGTVNGGLMQKIACSASYGQTFTAYVRTSGQDSTTAAIGIDPTGGGDITSANIVWQTTTASTWTQLTVNATSAATAITVFVKSLSTNAAGSNYHWSDFDDCTYTQGAPVGNGSISGTVNSSQGGGISGATVSTTTGGYTTTTNASGAYTLSNVAPATYSVVASKTNFNPQTNTGVVVTSGNNTVSNFTLTPQPGSISGNVKDDAAQNISGATVSTTTGGYTTTTNSPGNYTLSSVAPGTYSVTATKTNYNPQTNTGVVVTSNSNTVSNFTLTRQPGTISGTVTASGGGAISGASISTTTGGYTATTNASGAYTLSSVAVGTYSVVASKTGYQTGTNTGVVVTSNQTTTSNFTLTAVPTEKVTYGTMETFFSTGWGTNCSGYTSKLPGLSGSNWGWNNDGSYPFNTFDETTNKHGGSHSLGFGFCQTAASPGKMGIAYQNVNMGGSGASGTFSVWARHANGNCPTIMCWNPGSGQYDPYAANSAGRYQWICTDNWGQVNTWYTRSMTVTADSSGYVTIMVGGAAHTGTPSGAKLYIDDVSVQ